MGSHITKTQYKKRNIVIEPRKKPVQARSIESVRAILEAAAQVFESQGYGAGTTNRIADQAGVAVGTLYQYFPNKESVAVALLEDQLVERQRWINDWVAHVLATKMNLTQAITLFIEGMLDMQSDNLRLQHALLTGAPIPAGVRDAMKKTRQQSARTISGLFRMFPEVNKGSLDTAGLFVLKTVQALVQQFTAHPDDGLSRRAFTIELVSMIMAYLKE